MADITFYFPSAGAAPHDCAYSATWENTSQSKRAPLLTTRGTTDFGNDWYCYRVSGQHLGCGGQWVSAALAARSYTTADTFDFAFGTQDSNGLGGTTLRLTIRVFNAAGDTVIGTLYDGEINSTLWSGTITSRHADGVAVQNNVDLPENGHIVIEIGMHDTYAYSCGNKIHPQDLGIFGAVPLNDTTTINMQSLYPWLAFTYGAAAATNVVMNII